MKGKNLGYKLFPIVLFFYGINLKSQDFQTPFYITSEPFKWIQTRPNIQFAIRNNRSKLSYFQVNLETDLHSYTLIEQYLLEWDYPSGLIKSRNLTLEFQNRYTKGYRYVAPYIGIGADFLEYTEKQVIQKNTMQFFGFGLIMGKFYNKSESHFFGNLSLGLGISYYKNLRFASYTGAKDKVFYPTIRIKYQFGVKG